MADLESLRLRARLLLNLSAPTDAVPAYYALYHDPPRTRLTVHEDAAGHVDGFVAVCETGQRLFQPTVVLRTPSAEAAVELLQQALVPGRPYYLITTPDLRESVAEIVDIQQPEVNRIYRLDLVRFQPLINVLVVTEQDLGGRPRFVIHSHSQGEVAAESGANWASPHFVEVFVRTAATAQGRGWGRAVLTSCTTWVLRSARQPLYIVDERNERSTGLAEALGYVDTGAREFAGEGVCRA